MSQSRVVGVRTTLCDGRSGVRIPVGARDFSFLQIVRIGSVHPLPHRRLQFNWYRDYFPVVKRPRPEVNHSPPSSYELKNERSHTSAPPLWLHGVDKGNLNFYLLLYDIMMSCVCVCVCVCVCGWGDISLYLLIQWWKSLLIH